MRRLKKSHLLIWIFSLAILSTILILKTEMHKVDRAVQILFPVVLLKPGPDLLDPDNTETIWEYYLLENLSCGLVRDSKFSANGYEGCIAERFYQEDDNTWVFNIRQLQWSDGSQVTAQEVLTWIESLRSSSKRHIRFLKLADKVDFDEHSKQLKIHFPFKMDTMILHELSLADSGLLPTAFIEKGWGKTIGPYSVEEWTGSTLKLVANKFSPLYRPEMPQKAVLTKLADPRQRAQIFKSIDLDIVPLSATSNPKNASLVLPNAPQIWTSHPMAISFFYFNSKSKLAQNLANRNEFAAIVSEFRPQVLELTKEVLPCVPETQLVPDGFSGRLDSVHSPSQAARGDLKHIKIKLDNVHKESGALLDGLKATFKNHGIDLEFNFSDKGALAFESDEFAGVYGFLGNQLDASGSWAFLAGPPNGPLSPWMHEYKPIYDKIFHSNDIKDRQKNLKILHQEVLEKVIAVPLMVGSQRYLLSEKIDASRWNQFDSRLRIYDLQWK
jgi:MarR-like DNA-binding transcriptional regulator SgrR of sgrS sRNA